MQSTNKTLIYPSIIAALMLAVVGLTGGLVFKGKQLPKYSEAGHTSAGEQTVYEWSLVTTWPKTFLV